MPATAARSDVKVGTPSPDLATRSLKGRPPPAPIFAKQPLSPAMAPSDAVAMLTEHASGEGAAEARRAILGRIGRTYGNRFAGMVVAELHAREAERTGKPPAEPLEPERTEPPKAMLTAPPSPPGPPPIAAPAAPPKPAAPKAEATPAKAVAPGFAAAAGTPVVPAALTAPAPAAVSALPAAAKRAVPPEGKKEEGEPAPVEPAAKEAPEGKAEPKEAAAAAEPAAAKEGKAPAEGGKAKGEEAPGAPATPASPQQDPAFQAVIGRARSVAHQQGHSEPAKRKAAEAQAAAPGPANDVESQAAAAQVGKMDAQEPQPFDRAGFKAALLQKVAEITPKNLEEADEFKKGNKAASIKGAVTEQVKAGKDTAQGGIKQASEQAPDVGAAQPKPVAPLPPTEAGRPPADIGASAATPKPKSGDEVSLQAQSQSLDTQMADADVTEEQLKESNEPEFQGAVDAKGEAQTNAKEAPAAYRQDEQSVLAGAQAEAATSAGAKTAEMHDVRQDQFGKVVGDQGTTQDADREARSEVARHIQEIYDSTKQKVEQRLKQLDTQVNEIFDHGAEAAKQAFETYVDERMTRWKDDRYSRLGGSVLWLKDKLAGLPDEVNAFYQEGRQLYTDRMDRVIDQVATAVETGLADAKQLIRDGRAAVQTYVGSLEPGLREVGEKAAAGIQSKFDTLSQSVDEKGNQLVDQLAQKYVANLKAIDERINEMKAENRGLIDKAKDALLGVIETIINLKNMLLGVLARAAAVIGKIIRHPIDFLGNLVAGVKAGLSSFVSNIGAHLKKGLMEWLFGALAGAGVQLPETFDLKGMISLVLQVLGLTYANFRARAVAIVGEPIVKALEEGAEVFKVLVTEGISGLWRFIKDKLGDLQSMIMDAILAFVRDRIIIAGITWLIGLLNPASAFIKACKAIYDIIMFFVNRGSQIIALVNAVLDSIESIASGAIGVAASFVENALAKAIPVAIGFLASLLGLGDISGTIRSTIQKVQAPVNSAMDWVINQAVKLVKAAGGFIKGLFKDEGGKETTDPDHDAKVQTGLIAIEQEQLKREKDGKISRKAAEEIAIKIQTEHKIFKSITVIDGGSRWNYHYTASEGTKEGDQKEETIGDFKFLVFTAAGKSLRIVLSDTKDEVVIKERATKAKKLADLVNGLGVDRDVALALLNRLPGSDLDVAYGLFAQFARQKGDLPPAEFVVQRLRQQRVRTAAVKSLPGRETRSLLVHLGPEETGGEARETLSEYAVVFTGFPGQWVSRSHPEAMMQEYLFVGEGLPEVSTLGAIKVDDQGRVVEILEVSDKLPGGRATLIEYMIAARWKVAL